MGSLSHALAQSSVPQIAVPDIDWDGFVPLLILSVGGLLLLTFTSLIPAFRRSSTAQASYTVAVGLATGAAGIWLWRRVTRVCDDLELTGVDIGIGGSSGCESGGFVTADGAWTADGFAIFMTVLLAAAVVVSTLLLHHYVVRESLAGPEAFVLIMLSASGGLVMASANDLIVMFLGLEILSIAVYVLAGMHLLRISSQEAALKYLVLGAVASAFFLYGIALVYGATGTTNLSGIRAFLATNILTSSGTLLAGIALLLVGFAFKIGAVPFHAWTPDVYQGSPSAVVTFMASAVKAAAFAGLIRVFLSAFGIHGLDDWRPPVFVLAIVTMVVGALAAIVQSDVKRMLAYSSISHAGFILVGVHAASHQGVAAALFYLAAYVFMVAGSFGVISLLGGAGDSAHSLSDYKAMGKRNPGLALLLVVFLLAQAGIPLTSGFFAKFYVITAAVDDKQYILAVVAMLAATIGAFLYLRIIVTMFGGDDDVSTSEGAALSQRIRVDPLSKIGLGLCLVATILFGVLPGLLSSPADDAVTESFLVAADG